MQSITKLKIRSFVSTNLIWFIDHDAQFILKVPLINPYHFRASNCNTCHPLSSSHQKYQRFQLPRTVHGKFQSLMPGVDWTKIHRCRPLEQNVFHCRKCCYYVKYILQQKIQIIGLYSLRLLKKAGVLCGTTIIVPCTES